MSLSSTTAYQYKVAVFICRAQPVHTAHLMIIEKALKIAETVIISVGSARKPSTIKNPWSVAERKELILLSLKDQFFATYDDIIKRIRFSEVGDFLYDDAEWGAEVYVNATDNGATDDKETCIIGAFKDDSSWYLNFFPQWDLVSINLIGYKSEIINATDIRRELYIKGYLGIYKNIVSPSVLEKIEDWRLTEKGKSVAEQYRFIEEYKESHSFASPCIMYKPSSQTGDTIVHKSGHILLIKRRFNPGKGLYALPGGFTNANERILDSALRELKEETKIDVDMQILRDKIVHMEQFDHPKRSERGRIITNAYLIDLGKGPLPKVKASDDAMGAHWVHIREIYNMEEELFEDHFDIINRMTKHLR